MRRILLALLCICLTLAAPARAGSIALVLSDESAPYQEFASTLSQALLGSGWQVGFVGRADDLPRDNKADLIISAGGSAFRDLLDQRRSTPLLATLLSRSQYGSSLAGSAPPASPVSAILLDQPASRQAAFLRQLLPGRKRVGLLTSSQTKSQQGDFRKAVERAGLNLQGELVEHEGLLLSALESLLPRVDVLLAIPDGTLYQRQTIKPLLITAYRHQRPVIAFSASFVRAGALAALYSTPQQIAAQTASLLRSRGTRLPPPAGPDDFSISINTSVAEALGLTLPDENSLHRALREGGETP